MRGTYSNNLHCGLITFVDSVWSLLTTFRELILKVQAVRTCQLIWCRCGTKPETEIILSLKV